MRPVHAWFKNQLKMHWWCTGSSTTALLTQYSPNYNLTKELFSKLKYMTEQYEKQSEYTWDIESILYAALLHVTEDCQHWIADSRIYV